MGLTVFQPDFSLTTATPPFQNYPHSPKVRKTLDPYDHGAPGTRSPHWGKRQSPQRKRNVQSPPPKSPNVRYLGGRPYFANSDYEPQLNMPFEQDPISPYNRSNRIMTAQSPVPGEGRGSRLHYGTLGAPGLSTSPPRLRPLTQPEPFDLTTSSRSRRPGSKLGLHPPGKEPGLPLNERLAIRSIYLSPPTDPVNTMLGSVQVAVRDIKAPKNAPKESNFRMIADARANGRLFARSFAGGTPLAV